MPISGIRLYFPKEGIIMMDGIQGMNASVAASATQGAIKDTTGAQVVTKTLDKMNTAQTMGGPKVNADYQFQKDVLGAAGIGTMLDKIA